MTTETVREVPRSFRRIANSFEANIRAIQTLNEDVGQVAEERDKAAVAALRQDLCELFGVDAERARQVETIEFSLGRKEGGRYRS
jgi:hypothetical protein